MTGIFGGYTNDWYPKKKAIRPRRYHKYLKFVDLKILYPDLYGDDSSYEESDLSDKSRG